VSRGLAAAVLLGIVVIGGGIGPVLMLIGLTRVSGVTGSLLLNLEAVFTMALAVSVYGERLRWSEAVAAVVVMLLGFVGYGVSIVLDVYALRYVGAAREAAFFATAPCAGAIAAIPLLGEVPVRSEILGGLVMAVGVVAMVAARRDA